MNRDVRRKLAMANRVRDFCRAHPVDSTGFRTALEELDTQVCHLDELIARRADCVLAVRRHANLKRTLRATIRERYLRHLVRIARGWGHIAPALRLLLQLPQKKASGPTFLTEAQGIIAEASRYRDLFIQDGMAPTFVSDANELLAQYGNLLNGQDHESVLHAQLTTEMRELARELVQPVKRLDGINMLRFEGSPDLLAEWVAARTCSTSAPAQPRPTTLDPAA